MIFGVVAETRRGERRVALVPSAVKTLIEKGHSVLIEEGAGIRSGFDDAAYSTAGAKVASRGEVISTAESVLRVGVPTSEEISEMRKGQTFVGYVYPKRYPELLTSIASHGLNAFAMDAMPRSTRAQSMDVLSSQNNLAGYKSVIVGANALNKIFPLMMTAGGTVRPTRVLIYGAGVAGLQAIATARRLGAIVEVSDIRPETKEEVQSLGAKFISVEGLESVNVQGGYVAAVTDEVLAKQKEAVEKSLFSADLVITTALVAGGKAPRLITAEQVSKMKRGAVIVDLATEAGGNCELSQPDQTVEVNGVTIIGCDNLAATVPAHASELYAKNIVTFLNHAAKNEGFAFDTADEITSATLVVHNGEVRV
jgi:NAD(P) transhydrogenase subunit alpha